MQPSFGLFLAAVRFKMRDYARKILVRKLGIAIEAKELGRRRRRGLNFGFLPEKIEEALHASKTRVRGQKFREARDSRASRLRKSFRQRPPQRRRWVSPPAATAMIRVGHPNSTVTLVISRSGIAKYGYRHARHHAGGRGCVIQRLQTARSRVWFRSPCRIASADAVLLLPAIRP
jgi:hypothetical protein